MKDWQSIWLVFALYTLVLGIVFALSFNYRHSPQESAVAAHGVGGAAWLRPETSGLREALLQLRPVRRIGGPEAGHHASSDPVGQIDRLRQRPAGGQARQ